MPLNKIDYSKTIIYKIQHKEKKELFYVGHTTNFENRKCQHKKSSRNEPTKIYATIQQNGGWDMFEMVPIKQVVCLNRIAALIEEQKAIDEMKPTLNMSVAYGVDKQIVKVVTPDENERHTRIDEKIKRDDEKYQKKKEKLIKQEADFIAKIERRKLLKQ
jgi:hypothetical protein